MKIVARVQWKERYVGKAQVYLTGIDLDQGGDIKISGELPNVEIMTAVYEIEGEAKGRIYGNSFSLAMVNLKMKKVGEFREIDKNSKKE